MLLNEPAKERTSFPPHQQAILDRLVALHVERMEMVQVTKEESHTPEYRARMRESVTEVKDALMDAREAGIPDYRITHTHREAVELHMRGTKSETLFAELAKPAPQPPQTTPPPLLTRPPLTYPPTTRPPVTTLPPETPAPTLAPEPEPTPAPHIHTKHIEPNAETLTPEELKTFRPLLLAQANYRSAQTTYAADSPAMEKAEIHLKLATDRVREAGYSDQNILDAVQIYSRMQAKRRTEHSL